MVDEHYLKRELYDHMRSDPAIFEFLQAGSLDGIWFWDLDHPEHEWHSSRFWEVLGYSPSEKRHLASEWQNIIHPDDLRVALENFKKHCADPTHHYDQIVRYRHKDGSTVWVRCRGIVIRDSAGRPVRMLGAHNDVTELKRAEEELRQAERREMDTLLEVLPDGILMVNAEGHIVAANAQAEAMFGYQRGELLGQPIEALLPERSREIHSLHRAAFSAAPKKRPMGFGLDLYGMRKDETEFPVDISLGGVEGAESAVVICCVRDITERKRLESKLAQIQRMESVGLLAGGIAHDFNNLLTVINGSADIELSQLSEGDPLHDALVQIRRAGGRAAELTRQLLAFSRKQVLQPVVVNLNTVVTDIEKMLRRLIGEDIEMTVVSAQDLANVRVDPGQIEQVIVNLAVNARDAMPKGGTLKIETSNVEIDKPSTKQHSTIQPGPYAMLAISDTGAGMDEATREQIFEPLFTTKGPGKGTGFGLSTVYGIVEQSGGSIVVCSEVGSGTTFRIYLPRVEQPVRENRPARTVVASRGTETILIVEDEEALRSLINRALSLAGYVVIEAGNGDEALLQVERHNGPIQMILTDVVMPKMSGPELAQRVGKIDPWMKVLYMSGFTDDPIVRQGVHDENTHFIGKPFAVSELTRKVREVLDWHH
jgi:hypothetical protein